MAAKKPKKPSEVQRLQRSLKVAKKALRESEARRRRIRVLKRNAARASAACRFEIKRLEAPYQRSIRKLEKQDDLYSRERDVEKIQRLLRSASARQKTKDDLMRLRTMGG